MKEEVWLRAPEGALQARVDLPSSKSVSNRVLLIRALCREPFHIADVSEADDTRILQELIQNQPDFADCGAGGTTFRFLLALRCLQGIGGRISGSPRLVERPVRPLVETLQQLGAGIRYMEKEGFPPLQLSGGKMQGGSISIRADVSSQFVSALLLIAPRLPDGLRLQLSGKVVSSKYIDMTLALMRYFGVNSNVRDHTIEVPEAEYRSRDFTVPSDWSAAAFFYAMAALKPGSALTLPGLAEDVFQGDRALEVLMEDWGVSTERQGAEVLIRSRGIPERSFSYDFNDTPDLAQAFVVMAAVSKRRLTLRGLSTLKDKETNRLLALKTELERAGAEIVIGEDSLDVVQGVDVKKVPQEKFRTYHDHRMVMALSMLSIGAEGLSLLQPGHVTKSFPSYFAVLKEAGFLVEER